MTDSFTTDESLVTIEPQTVIDIIKVAHEEQKCTDGRTCSSLARVAVHDENILRVSFEIVIALLCYLEKERKGWSVMVWPVVACDSITEVSLSIVGSTL